jgi:RNA polymerase sigma-70 factor (ECF subfamily)
MTGSGGTRQDELAAEYTRIRPRLLRAAYALLGTWADAEDVVADSWLRLAASDQRDPVADVEAWAVVAVSRRALDVLRSARVQREAYVGPWLPEPLVERLPGPAGPDALTASADLADPADRVTLDESVSYALMVVLETLTPAERTAFVLHDLFGVPFTEVAGVVGRGPAAVRQLATRARAHVRAGAPRMTVSSGEHQDTVDAFFRAAAGGDIAGLVAVLDPDVVVTSDGGGQAQAARRPVRGAERAARFLVGVAAKIRADQRVVPMTVNGGPGLALVDPDGTASLVGALTVAEGRILRVDLLVAPAKLARTRFTSGPRD